MTVIRILEGFPNQHLFRLPSPVLARWRNHPLLQSLMPTDIGWFPRARYHYCERRQGAAEHILLFCTAGEGWVEVEGVHRPVFANQAIFIRQHVPHVYGSSVDDPWSLRWAHFIGIEGMYYLSQAPADGQGVLLDEQCRLQVETLFDQCYHVLMDGFVLNRLIHAAKILHHLLSELFFNNQAFSATQRTNHFRSIEPTLRYLRENMHAMLTLDDMANHAGLSKSHFSRIFRNQTGYSPVEYFIHLKVQKALSLLVLTNLPVQEIALMVGYADPYYFSRLFKKIVGVSPTASRLELPYAPSARRR
jgi:AraC family transcriptional regulator of arabinose operon